MPKKQARGIEAEKYGTLYVVSTPIGNLDDMTFRAVEVLKNVQLIAAEDTRRSSILTRRYDIKTSRVSFNDYNAKKRIPALINRMHEGQSIALISDAGTPGISDPGYLLIKNCIECAIQVIPVPGPSALIAALVVSGLPTDRFVFEGFLPVKKGRTARLKTLAAEKRTIILYESPHRIVRTLNDLFQNCGDRNIVIAREVTKMHEEVLRMCLSEAVEHFNIHKPKGEFVLVLDTV